VTVQVRFKDFVWIEDIIALAEQSASSDLYALLKRPDEKYVAERAYENPRFVEDIVRIIANGLLQDEKITWFAVKSINFESIHNHNAYAFIIRDKRISRPLKTP
jgi:GTP cyclohydrolase I